jgi:hypothetical protein
MCINKLIYRAKCNKNISKYMNITLLQILYISLQIYARVANKYLSRSMSSFEKNYTLENR